MTGVIGGGRQRLHTARMTPSGAPLARLLTELLDPAVRAELEGEHLQIAEDLELLQWLLATTPDSPDIPVLAASLARRMREHVERDARLLSSAEKLRTKL